MVTVSHLYLVEMVDEGEVYDTGDFALRYCLVVSDFVVTGQLLQIEWLLLCLLLIELT